MKRSFNARMILAVLVTMGLLMAPLTASALPKSDMMAATMDMSGDMPCCPDADGHKQSDKNDCKDCLLMAVCAPKTVQALLATALGTDLNLKVSSQLFAIDDRLADGLSGTPPARPPRSLV